MNINKTIALTSLLNSVKSCDLKNEVSRKITKDTKYTRRSFIKIITNSFKHLKRGKACSIDGLAAEHFLYLLSYLCISITSV